MILLVSCKWVRVSYHMLTCSVFLRERDFGVVTVDGTWGSPDNGRFRISGFIDFKEINEASDVAMNVGAWILHGVSDTSLSGQMHDVNERDDLEELLQEREIFECLLPWWTLRFSPEGLGEISWVWCRSNCWSRALERCHRSVSKRQRREYRRIRWRERRIHCGSEDGQRIWHVSITRFLSYVEPLWSSKLSSFPTVKNLETVS